VYTRLLSAALPQLLHVVDPAPWRHGAVPEGDQFARSARVGFRRLSATLAIGTLRELQPGRADRDYLAEVVRSSLIRWQLSLRGDGRPLHRRSLASPFHGATVGRIIHLLGETSAFQTPMLLDDIERHLAWVSRRRVTAPWLEAAAICAMAEGAVLVRDTRLLARARERLSGLLCMQHAEGWFPENHGADIGRLSLTVDALARLYHQCEWHELHDALRRSFGFLTHFVHSDGGVGGCYSTRSSAFSSPLAGELMAREFPESAALARAWRCRCRAHSSERLLGYDEDRAAAIAAGVAMAATCAERTWRKVSELPCDGNARVRFPAAGLTVISTKSYYAVVNGRKGGAIHLSWRDGGPPVIDGGLTVIYPHRWRSSASMDGRTRVESSENSVRVRGVFRRSGERHGCVEKWWRRVKDALRASRRSPVATPPGTGPSEHSWASRDHFEREVTFGEDWIRISDQVHCRLPCQAVICQSPPPRQYDWLGSTDPDEPCLRAPLFFDGGRNVTITRCYRNGELAEKTCEVSRVRDWSRLDACAQ